MKGNGLNDNSNIDFGSDNIPWLFRALFFPTLIGMVFNAVLTVIDGVFVGQGVGSNGIAAVNIVAPLFMVITGIGLMFGIGSSVIAGIRLANKDYTAANDITTQAFAVGSIMMLAIVLPCVLFPEQIVNMLGCSDVLRPFAMDYLLWLIPGLMFLLIECIGMMLIRLDGSPKYAMWCNVIAATLNIILDYLFVFPLGMGVMGAALATSISCGAGGLMIVYYFVRRSTTLHFRWQGASATSLSRILKNTIRMSAIGFAACLTELAMSVMMLTGNYVFINALGEDGVAAFSIACYLFPVMFSMSNAVAQSAQPIISYNYGAGDMMRVSRTLRTSLTAALICGTLVTLLVIAGAGPIVRLFLAPESGAYEIACDGLPLYAVCGIFFALNIAFIGYYQSLERAYRASLFTLMRGVLFIVPLFIIMPRMLGVPGMWLAIPASELLTLIVIFIDYKLHRRTLAGPPS